MSKGGEQNGVQYVVSLPAQEQHLNLKKVNLKHIPTSAVTQIVKCTNLVTLTHGSNSSSANIKRSIDNNEKLTVVSEIDHQGEVSGDLRENEVLNIEQVPKRLKTDVSMQSLRKNVRDETDVRSEVITNDKISDGIGTDDEWDEDTLEEFDDVSDTYINRPSQFKTGRKRSTSKDEAHYYTSSNSFKSRRIRDSVDKKKGKPKLFRAEWLNIDIFRDWLARDPTNPRKARCLACNTTMNAGKSELEKHATGARHCQNVQVMQNQQMLLYQEGDEVSDMMTNVEVSLSEEEPVGGDDIQSHYQEQQLEALNKIAASVDNLASNVTIFFEKMCSNQETLIQVLQQLVSK
ncbi:uncharacterized protein LOC126272950 [Schistocerca gregaria]|uniref:uncharacterized protein LOC126272950 n=1 Tax=Schistocerca gregaria TaxID=7010 RepID=UPI00211DF804|nr:uncharacterized protein LOC126272950 [Schistocerca gregaria]